MSRASNCGIRTGRKWRAKTNVRLLFAGSLGSDDLAGDRHGAFSDGEKRSGVDGHTGLLRSHISLNISDRRGRPPERSTLQRVVSSQGGFQVVGEKIPISTALY